MTKVSFIGNQGGHEVYAFYAGMAAALRDSEAASRIAVWLDREKADLDSSGFAGESLSFESFVAKAPTPLAEDVHSLVREYREVNWSEVVAAERAFTDYSMLLGTAGDRRESPEYVQALVVSIVRFLENALAGCSAMVCQTADTLFSLIAFKVAHHLKVPAYAISPAWLLEPGQGGGSSPTANTLKCGRWCRPLRRVRGWP